MPGPPPNWAAAVRRKVGIELQKQRFGGQGFIVTNPNCSTIGLVIPIAALEKEFGVEAVQVVTMQALSGAGYPGVASMDVIDNVLPSIGNGEEEEKMVDEEEEEEEEEVAVDGRMDGWMDDSLS